MVEYESREVRALRSISKAQKGPPKEFQKNMAQVNASIRYLSEYMVIMQKGIDDSNKDIIQKIQDAIDELLILFAGGTAIEDIFDFGNLEVFFNNLGAIFGIDNLLEPIDLGAFIDDFFENVTHNGVVQMINDFIADFLSAIDGATGGVFNLDDLADRIRLTETVATTADTNAIVAQNTANAAQAAVAELIADSNGADEVGGLTITRRFRDGDGPAVSGTMPGFAFYDSNKIGVINELARWYLTGTSGSTGDGYARHNTQLTVDDQEVSITFGTALSEIAWTGVFLRANAGMTAGVIAYVNADQLRFGTFNWGGSNNPNFSQITQIIRNFYNGDIIRVRAVGNVYTVYHNGYPIYINTHASIPKGASYRYHGMAFARAVNFGFYQSSGQVLLYTAKDIIVPATVGTGWELVRTATSAAYDFVNGYNPLTGDVYGVIRLSAQVTVAHTGQGEITIIKPGFYHCFIRFEIDENNDSDDDCRSLLYKRVSGGSTFDLMDVSPEQPFGAYRSIYGHFQVYCNVGDTLKPGFRIISNDLVKTNAIGDTLGTLTYFKGCLASGAGG